MTDTSPAEDLEVLDIAAETALSSYAQNGGGFHPFGVVALPTGLAIVPSEGFSNDDEKARFIAGMRFLSIENSGSRSALAMETWTLINQDAAAHALLDEIYARGGSMSEHPDAGEAILVIVESDAGSTQRMHRIVRDGNAVTLEPGETNFEPAGSAPKVGFMSGFHVPTALQSKPGPQMFVAAMREFFNAHYAPITPDMGTKASKPN